jgi:hypothetical protein
MAEVKCSMCRRLVDTSLWHIIGVRSKAGTHLYFFWNKGRNEDADVVLAGNRCVRRYYTKVPDYKERLKELLTQ